jgi:hypothetical protein
MDFGSLQHVRVRKSTCRGGSTPRYVPPSGFGYPLDGLLLPSPCRVWFAPAALLGFTLRSFPLSPRYPWRLRPEGPTCRFSAGTVSVETMTRSGRPRLLGFAPCESPSRSARVFSTTVRRLLPWVSPLSGLSCECLDRDPSRSPLTRFAELSRRRMPGRRLRVSISSRLASSRPAANSRPRTRQPS